MTLIALSEAKARILKDVTPLKQVMAPLEKARGRVLASDLEALHNQPPFDSSSMDGYAVRAADIKTLPASLKVIGESAAGQVFNGTLTAGTAVRIFTGAQVPQGADTVIMQENTRRDGDSVTVLKGAAKGNFIRKTGLDFAYGEPVLKAGTLLDARHIGLAAAMNHAEIPVRTRPRVAILANGDELVMPGQTLGSGQIVASNSFALAAAVESWGGVPVDLGIAPDDREAIARAIQSGADADVLVTIGGASVGDHDLVGPAFEDLGIRLDFWRIAMRPGKPVMFARKDHQRIIGVPGNPVSSLVSALVFIRPLLDAMLGFDRGENLRLARLGKALGANDKRQDHLRATLHRDENGELIATPFDRQDSSMQRIFARADCLIIRPPMASAAQKGDLVEIMMIQF